MPLTGPKRMTTNFVYPDLDGLHVDQKIEALAFMRANGFTPAGRCAGGRSSAVPVGVVSRPADPHGTCLPEAALT